MGFMLLNLAKKIMRREKCISLLEVSTPRFAFRNANRLAIRLNGIFEFLMAQTSKSLLQGEVVPWTNRKYTLLSRLLQD
jgi:hypothetical protein